MNEDAIKDAYDLFVNTGYNKSYDNFKALIQSNPNARKDAYDLFVSTGYKKTQKDFDELMGIGAPAPVKKKNRYLLLNKKLNLLRWLLVGRWQVGHRSLLQEKDMT